MCLQLLPVTIKIARVTILASNYFCSMCIAVLFKSTKQFCSNKRREVRNVEDARSLVYEIIEGSTINSTMLIKFQGSKLEILFI